VRGQGIARVGVRTGVLVMHMYFRKIVDEELSCILEIGDSYFQTTYKTYKMQQNLAPRCRVTFSKICTKFTGRSAHPLTVSG
jgi:hypothetical protein